MEENFSMEWKIFILEWKWNRRKLTVRNMEKSSSIPYHALFSILLDNNTSVPMQYFKTMITFKNLCENKSFNLTIRSVFEKLVKKWGSTINGCLHWGSN